MSKLEKDMYMVEKDMCESPSNKTHGNTGIGCIIIILVLILIFIVLPTLIVYHSFPHPKNDELQIESLSWERSIELEKIMLVEESGDTLPEGAQLISKENEIYGYESVLDQTIVQTSIDCFGTEKIVDKKEVYKSIPKTKDRYYYKISKWVNNGFLVSGGDDKDPYWPEIPKLPSDERTSEKKEAYFICGYTSNSEYKRISMKYSDWIQYDEGQKVKIIIYPNGNIGLSE